jgi:hypothetical protein
VLARAASGWAVDCEFAVERLDAIEETAEARAASGVGAAVAVVIDVDERARWPRATVTRTQVAWACLATFASASETRK